MIDNNESILKNPVVIAAIITVIGTIIVAVIQYLQVQKIQIPVDPPPSLIFWGRVADYETNKAIPNAKITVAIIGEPTINYSGEDGLFILDLGPGINTLSGLIIVEANGYHVYSEEILVKSKRVLQSISLNKIVENKQNHTQIEAKSEKINSEDIKKIINEKTNQTELNDLRNRIRNGDIKIEYINKILRGFEFDKNTNTNTQEASKMLIALGVEPTSEQANGAISGKVEDGKEITVWPNSYNNPRQYGIRFGKQDRKYYMSNETLISVSK